MELVLTGRQLTSKEALQLNIVDAVVEHKYLDMTAWRWVKKILETAPLAVRASKQTLLRGLDEPSLAVALDNHEYYPVVKRLRASKDAEEGIRAFSEKRRPNWSGH